MCVHLDVASNQVVLSVSDTGIGIPSAEHSRIFERFYHVENSRSSDTGGTGLGLAIVKHIVMNHGGHIDLQSESGEGTRITIILPHTTDEE